MTERPILMSAPMVRATLAGIKTQTRRLVKQTSGVHTIEQVIATPDSLAAFVRTRCPYGQLGDRLWVRESGWERPERTPRMMREGADTWPRFAYAADDWSDEDRADFKRWGFKPRPSIHMPRWASRITLGITAVRVERLQIISEADARLEGVKCGIDCPDHRIAFGRLWEQINGAGSWVANPWVWVIEFKLVAP